jgi:hypothetical protein
VFGLWKGPKEKRKPCGRNKIPQGNLFAYCDFVEGMLDNRPVFWKKQSRLSRLEKIILTFESSFGKILGQITSGF